MVITIVLVVALAAFAVFALMKKPIVVEEPKPQPAKKAKQSKPKQVRKVTVSGQTVKEVPVRKPESSASATLKQDQK